MEKNKDSRYLENYQLFVEEFDQLCPEFRKSGLMDKLLNNRMKKRLEIGPFSVRKAIIRWEIYRNLTVYFRPIFILTLVFAYIIHNPLSEPIKAINHLSIAILLLSTIFRSKHWTRYREAYPCPSFFKLLFHKQSKSLNPKPSPEVKTDVVTNNPLKEWEEKIGQLKELAISSDLNEPLGNVINLGNKITQAIKEVDKTKVIQPLPLHYLDTAINITELYNKVTLKSNLGNQERAAKREEIVKALADISTIFDNYLAAVVENTFLFDLDVELRTFEKIKKSDVNHIAQKK